MANAQFDPAVRDQIAAKFAEEGGNIEGLIRKVEGAYAPSNIQYRRMENGSYQVAVVISHEVDIDAIDDVTDGLSDQKGLPGHIRLMDVDNQGAYYAIDAGRTDSEIAEDIAFLSADVQRSTAKAINAPAPATPSRGRKPAT